ncbi:hypothetical protein [Kamptonema animale]|nr:hypothetical protein [Kamptonema animale]
MILFSEPAIALVLGCDLTLFFQLRGYVGMSDFAAKVKVIDLSHS